MVGAGPPGGPLSSRVEARCGPPEARRSFRGWRGSGDRETGIDAPRRRVVMRRSRSARRLLTSGGAGGSVIRHLLPAAIGALVVLGFLRWLGEDQGLYGAVAGVLLMTAVCITVVGGLLWYFALWVDRDEIARHDVEAELRRSSRYFELSRDLVCTAGLRRLLQAAQLGVDGDARVERGRAARAAVRGVRPRRRPRQDRGADRRTGGGRRHGRLRQPLRRPRTAAGAGSNGARWRSSRRG